MPLRQPQDRAPDQPLIWFYLTHGPGVHGEHAFGERKDLV
jgi:hypothetical protein